MPRTRLRVPGKWVISGEHAVLRGADAVALPHPEFALELEFESASTNEIDPPGAEGVILGILEEARRELAARGRPIPAIEGRISIRSTIPLGAGLGSSAALCVAITRWLGGASNLDDSQWLAFARTLEDRFHGRSSGMDVAAVLAGVPIRFNMASGIQAIPSAQLPKFSFHDTGRRARTIDCVSQVEEFGRIQPTEARAIDLRMSGASELAVQGLEVYGHQNAEIGLDCLARAMSEAQSCFEAWGLMFPEAKALKDQLKSEGALAVKLTGAGRGGFLAALWPDALRQSWS